MGKQHRQQAKYDRYKKHHDKVISEHEEKTAAKIKEEERKLLDKEIDEAVRRNRLREKAQEDKIVKRQ